jgi:Tfp pilus assembly protein PilX
MLVLLLSGLLQVLVLLVLLVLIGLTSLQSTGQEGRLMAACSGSDCMQWQ